MGHKSNPIGLRLQINRTWDSRWFAEGADYGRLLLEDLKIRQYIMKNLPQAAISKVVIERPAKLCRRSDEHTSELQSLMRISFAVFCLNKTHGPTASARLLGFYTYPDIKCRLFDLRHQDITKSLC